MLDLDKKKLHQFKQTWQSKLIPMRKDKERDEEVAGLKFEIDLDTSKKIKLIN